MFAARIEREESDHSGQPATIASVRAALTSVATGLDLRFVKAGTMLTHMIETVDQLVERLDSMHEALSPAEAGASIADLHEAARLISEVPARSAAREALLSSICNTATHLEQEVVQTQNILKALRILSVNIRIATMDDASFKYLVNDIVERLSEGERILTPLSHIIAVLMRALRRAMDAVRQLSSEAQKVMPLVPPQLTASAEALAAYQHHVTQSASATASLARGVQGKVAAVLGALQIGDSTRQRIEHVTAGLRLLEEQAGGDEGAQARRAVLDLLADQLSDTSDNLASETAVLSGTLASISDDANKLRSTDGDTGKSGHGGAAMLQGLHRSIMNVSYLTQQVRSTNAQIGQIVSTVFASLEELRERMKVVRTLRADVEQIAINVRLKCHRDMSSGKAVAIIAVEVRRFSMDLHEAIKAITDHLEKLAGLSERLREENDFAEKADISDILERSMETIGTACDKVDAAADQAQRNSSEALGLLDATARDLDDQGGLVDALDGLATLRGEARRSDGGDDDGALAEALLARIARSYTMARERQIHQRHATIEAPPAPGQASVASAGDGDDDLDGLFL